MDMPDIDDPDGPEMQRWAAESARRAAEKAVGHTMRSNFMMNLEGMRMTKEELRHREDALESLGALIRLLRRREIK